jgi:hypothetical protein
MPVRKFRDLQSMEDALWREPGSPELAHAIARVWDFARRTCPRRFPPGVHRHRSVESAQRQRDAWEADDFEAFWQRQRQAGVAPGPLPGRE